MKAMTVIPGQASSAQVAEVPDPPDSDGSVLVEGLLVGICGTDGEIMQGYGQPPDGEQRLVIGHESLGRVADAPAGAGMTAGDLVVGIVRRPDPVPCPGVRGRPVGLLRERPVHRARHQGQGRLRRQALAGRPAVRDPGAVGLG